MTWTIIPSKWSPRGCNMAMSLIFFELDTVMVLERFINIKREIRLKVWRSEKKLSPKILLVFIKLVMDDDRVNLWIHHGGKWDCPKKKKQYLGGEVKIMENVDIDFLSMFELEGLY
ncbi:unnamed protein product [Cuscuta epithymum]|uniref:PB1-like domain-containing protein n=1 Tax=Cuscuta epithymum TaxID=186058 RepID=A0AAV0DSL8_9ASTE|nr:unnamed protein product [Cuscuta epithymum]